MKTAPSGRSRARASVRETNTEDEREQQSTSDGSPSWSSCRSCRNAHLPYRPQRPSPDRPGHQRHRKGCQVGRTCRPRGRTLGRRRAAPGAKWAAERGRDGARWAGERTARGTSCARHHRRSCDSIPIDDIADSVREYVDGARESDQRRGTRGENDLRKAVRRHRKRIVSSLPRTAPRAVPHSRIVHGGVCDGAIALTPAAAFAWTPGTTSSSAKRSCGPCHFCPHP